MSRLRTRRYAATRVDTIRALTRPTCPRRGRSASAAHLPGPDSRRTSTRRKSRQLLAGQGYTRIHEERAASLHVIQDRFRWSAVEPARANDAIEAALKVGQGRLDVYPQRRGWLDRATLAFLHRRCIARTAISPTRNRARAPSASIRPSARATPAAASAAPSASTTASSFPMRRCRFATAPSSPGRPTSYKECQTDLIKFARKRGIPLDTPWRDLTDAQRGWVIEGEGEWTKNVWYGVRRFFAWLETKAYKMHIRVLLSRYRSYTECSACRGVAAEAGGAAVADPRRARAQHPRADARCPSTRSRAFFAELALPRAAR